MAPRRTTLSGKSEHRSRSISPLLRTDTRDNEQHTNPPPFPRGRVIPDSQEDPSDFDLSADDTEEAELEPEQAITGTKNQYSSFDTVDTVEEDFEAQRALAGVNDQQESFNTVDTVLIPGGTKLSPRPEPRNVSQSQQVLERCLDCPLPFIYVESFVLRMGFDYKSTQGCCQIPRDPLVRQSLCLYITTVVFLCWAALFIQPHLGATR